jgi:arylsulfatase A-like enzyme
VLDNLASLGRRFPRCYVSPLCSPTRAAILSGVHTFRNGVGHVMRRESCGELAEYGDPGFAFTSLPERLATRCRTGMVGKIHLSIPTNETVTSGPWTGRSGSGWNILDRLGFDFSATVLRNLSQNDGVINGGAYYLYGHKYSGFEPAVETQYATSQQVDSAIHFLSGLGSQRGFLYLALSASHSPWGKRNFPPVNLVTSPAYLDVMEDETSWPTYMASMEAIDTELGRLMNSLTPAVRQRTTFVILSDNGPSEPPLLDARDIYGLDLSPEWDAIVNQSRIKTSPYHFGVWGPMIWYGPTPDAAGVDNPGKASVALIDQVDLYATIADYFDADPGVSDSVSFLDLAWHGSVPGEELTHGRQTSLSESFLPMGDWTQAANMLQRSFRSRVVGAFTRSGLFELVRRSGHPDELYQLEDLLGQAVDPFESSPIDVEGLDHDLYLHILGQLEALLASTLP